MKMRKMMLSLAVMLSVLSVPVHAAEPEKPEMTTYSFDLSQFEGGSPDDYEYSFDKENWTKERTWEVEVGKDYELYVKYPDGNVGLITFFKGGDISPMGENPDAGAGSGTSEPKETEPTESSEAAGTKEDAAEDEAGKAETGAESMKETGAEEKEDVKTAEDNQEGFLKVAFVVLLFAVVVLFGGGFFFMSRNKKSK